MAEAFYHVKSREDARVRTEATCAETTRVLDIPPYEFRALVNEHLLGSTLSMGFFESL
jgi:hypothetical protein